MDSISQQDYIFKYGIKRQEFKIIKMKDIIFCLLSGFIFGFCFTMFKLPLPAPPTFAGVSGIIGVYLGFIIFMFLFK